MKFTFGIITTKGNELQVQAVLDSISSQQGLWGNDECYEVIIVGGDIGIKDKNFTIIPFDESKRKSWITRKKNIITENAKYENIVYMHDYICLEPDWYINYKILFREQFHVCTNPIKNLDGSRFRDWSLWPHDITPDGSPDLNSLLPYDVTDLSKFMYISGAYWVSKKWFMEEFPLNESLSWGESEDVEWSKRVRQQYPFTINPHSSVKLLKQKERIFNYCTSETISKLRTQVKYENLQLGVV